jgi:hypothetical protein
VSDSQIPSPNKVKTKGEPSDQDLLDLKYDLATDLYRQSARALEAKSRGLERKMYKWLGPDLMGSIALALDPYWQFNDKLNSLAKESSRVLGKRGIVIPFAVNRTRYFNAIFGGDCKEQYVRTVTGIDAGGRFVGPPTFWVQYEEDSGTLTFKGGGTLFSQPTIFGSIMDYSSKKAREDTQKASKTQASKGKQKKIKKEGEFELYAPSLDSSTSGVSYRSSYVDYKWPAAQGDGTLYNRTQQTETKRSSISGPSAMVSTMDSNALKQNYHDVCLDLMAKYLPVLITDCVPTRRNFNLGYQIAELKDSLQLYQSTVKTWAELESIMTKVGFKLALADARFWSPANRRKYAPLLRPLKVRIDPDKSAAEAFLNFKFGWQSIYQAVIGLLSKPSDAAKEVNRLVARNGLNTTLSRERFLSNVQVASPSITIARNVWEYSKPSVPNSLMTECTARVRCVVNSGIRFPDVENPSFQKQLFLLKMGLIPYPSDFYSLVPWTWLVDWFSGLGQYLRVQEELNGSKLIINYGFMSVHLNARYTASATVFRDTHISVGLPYSPGPSVTDATESRNLSAVMNCKYILRKSIGNIADIGQYSGQNLTDSQSAILTALFSTFVSGSKPNQNWKRAPG